MASGSTPPWTTIESDPGVFTELIEQMGTSGVQVEELYSLDDSVKELRPVYGLIFLFKWRPEKDDRQTEPPDQGSVYFARQIITNACATQAIIGILFNSPSISLGPELAVFRDFTADLPPDLKGESLGDSELIRQTHNSFAAPHSFLSEEARAAKEEDDVFHFISYLPAMGRLWELDGLKPGPIDLGPCSEEDWLDRVQPSIQARIQRYASSEIRFNLMAVVADRRVTLRRQIQDLADQRQAAQERVSSAEASTNAPGPEDSRVADIEATTSQLEQDLAMEEEKRTRWRDDNIARKHNYIPLMFTFLRLLAERQELQPLIDKAKASS